MQNTTIFNPNIISTPLGPHQQQQQQNLSYSQYQQPMSYQTATNLNPSLMQTSQYNANQTLLGGYDLSSCITFSAKHNGLYLYVCRILRPIWNICCVDRVLIDGKKVFVSILFDNIIKFKLKLRYYNYYS